MLRQGQKIQAKLIEAVEENSWIVSFKGDLLQVKNTTTIIFKEGLLLNLQVVQERPLQLKVISKESGLRNKVDVII